MIILRSWGVAARWNFLIVLVFLASLAGCTKTAEVTGQVLDNFGQPLAGTTIKVANTTFSATTDGKGNYAVKYVPGKVKVEISKEGYTSAGFVLDIATESTYPAQPVMLYELPKGKGIFRSDSTPGHVGYIPLLKGTLTRKRQEYPFSYSNPVFRDTYFVASDKILDIKSGAEITFLDNDGLNPILYR